MQLTFGGKIIIFGRHFHQVLPVISQARKEDVINASLLMSYLWPQFIKIQLTKNTRANSDLEFSKFLLRTGDGKERKDDNDYIKLPNIMIIPFKDDFMSLQKLTTIVFPKINDYPNNLPLTIYRAIWTPKNDYVVNDILIKQFPDNPIKYYSFD